MADNSGPDDHFRFQDDPPAPQGTPKPKRPRTPEKTRRPRPARKGRDEDQGAESSAGAGAFPWFKKQPITWKHYVVLAAIVVPLLGFAAGMAIWQNQHRAWEQKAFGAAMGDFLAPTAPAPAGAPRPAFGKAVMADVNKRKLDDLQESLPGDMRAATPEEVTTVVQLRYTEQEVGQYTGGGRALKVTCHVTVVDRASRTVVGSASFTSADPPQLTRTSAGEDDRGALPIKDIIGFLKQLRQG